MVLRHMLTYGLTFDTWLGSTIRSTCSLCGPTSLQKSTPAKQLNSTFGTTGCLEVSTCPHKKASLLASLNTYFGQALGGLTAQNRNLAQIVEPRRESWKSTIVIQCVPFYFPAVSTSAMLFKPECYFKYISKHKGCLSAFLLWLSQLVPGNLCTVSSPSIFPLLEGHGTQEDPEGAPIFWSFPFWALFGLFSLVLVLI